MKSVTYSEKVKRSPEAFSLLQQATQRLEEVLGPSRPVVNAEWNRKEDDRDRPVYTLKLSDFAGSVQAAFTPEELNSPSLLRYRLRDLVGDLLQVRSHKQLEIF